MKRSVTPLPRISAGVEPNRIDELPKKPVT
jgi:hypothetical protein